MRLYLLPISNRRTLLYCQRINVSISKELSVFDKASVRAAKLWETWEAKDSGWQKKVVVWGNNALRRIPFEEWGLKSIPPLSARLREQELEAGQATVEVSFPSIVIPKEEISEVLRKLGTDREALHKSRMIYCFVGMPISAPIALVPMYVYQLSSSGTLLMGTFSIPNIPFFYLVYRAWSHWRALAGSKHIQFLLSKGLVAPNPSPILDILYSPGIMKAMRPSVTLGSNTPKPADSSTPLLENKHLDEVMLLGEGDSARIAKALGMPELHAELDRAIWQVESERKN